MTATILSFANPKTLKGESLGILTGVVHLLPAGEYDRLRIAQGLEPVRVNLCPFAGACKATCLNTAGRGGLPMRSYAAGPYRNNVEFGRYRRTDLYHADRAEFVRRLLGDLRRLAAAAAAHGLQPAARLNGTSDVDYESDSPEVIAAAAAAGIRLYDYTKRMRRFNPRGAVFYVYSLDVGPARERHAIEYLRAGGNVAIVFDVPKGQPLPATWRGFPVFDADVTDVRYLDPAGHVSGLRAKGHAKQDRSGFVVPGVAT
jgi:hypothetical protein